MNREKNTPLRFYYFRPDSEERKTTQQKLFQPKSPFLDDTSKSEVIRPDSEGKKNYSVKNSSSQSQKCLQLRNKLVKISWLDGSKNTKNKSH